MTNLDLIPETHREKARDALSGVFGASPLSGLTPVTGGASGALVYRFEAGARACLLRLETARDFFRDPARTFACMRAAAEAGIAPALHHTDPAAGVAIMDFIETKPLTDFSGGPAGIAQAMGEMAARLHALPAFPALADYPALINVMFSRLASSTLFAKGLLAPHAEGLEAIRRAYRWDMDGRVASHNDPNPRNVLYDGQRLWLIDWEISFQNDPLTDLAVLADNFARTPDLEDALLTAALGRAPDAVTKARLTLMRQMTRLFYACAILSAFAAQGRPEPDTDLSAPTPEEFMALIAAGKLVPGTPDTTYIFGKLMLAGFRNTLDTGPFKGALAVAGDGA